MLVYYINLLLILGLAFPLCILRPSKLKKIIYLAVTFSYMWFIATIRYGIGYDYYNYIYIFQDIAATSSLGELFTVGRSYMGYALLSKGMSLFIASETVMYGVYELLILLPVVHFIYRYCKDVWLSTWLYVTLTFFYTTMNFTRQSLAVSICLLGYGFLRDKKPIPYLAIVLAASTFHITALILIPVYFLAHLRLSKRVAIVYSAAALLSFLFSAIIIDLVTDYIFVGYKNSYWVVNGLPLIFLIVPAAVFGSCLALSPIWNKRYEEAPLLLNLMLFSLIIWLFLTRHFILERFSMYVYIYVILALPQAISCLRRPQEDHEQLAALRESAKGKPGKELQAKIRALAGNISDHEKYYWCAVAAVIIVTLIYNEFGANVNKFHGIFPRYHSVFDWLNTAPYPPDLP